MKARLNEIKSQQNNRKISKDKTLFFKKINKMDELLARPIKK